MVGWGHGAWGGRQGTQTPGRAVVTDLSGEFVNPEVEIIPSLTDGEDCVNEGTWDTKVRILATVKCQLILKI